MFCEFRQAVHFPGKGKDKGHSFSCGQHEVPEEVQKHPYFLNLVKAGLVFEADKPSEAKQESVEERAKRLHDKLSAKPQAPKHEEESKKDKKGKK